MKKRVKRVLIGASVIVTALVASVAALVLLVFGGVYVLLLSMEMPYWKYYPPKEVHRLYMNTEEVAVTCKPLEIVSDEYDAELVCGAMELDSWDLKFFARWEGYRYETAISVYYSSCDHLAIYENDTAQVWWFEYPRWYSLPEGTYQRVYEHLQELDASPDTEDLG